MTDRYRLQRFVDAQAGRYDEVLGELRDGGKVGHWMWFVFPQIAGLGSSLMARKFAISSLDEACAYLAHPVLGRRLVECAILVDSVSGRTARQVFGSPDDLKLRSSMTLFARAWLESSESSAEPSPFQQVLDHYFDGLPDQRTIERLQV